VTVDAPAPQRGTPDESTTSAPTLGWARRLTDRTRDVHPAAFALGAAVVIWIATFAFLVVRRHDRFWDVDFDMGIQDQAVWLLARGRGFVTVRGLQVFGHHATPGYFLLAPASWFGAGPDFLNIVQVTVLALGAFPVYLIARARGVAPWAAAALGTAFLLHPALQFFAWELFHPEVLAITPLLCAYLCATRRSWGWFAAWAVLAVAWKEDVALAVIVLGLIIAWRGDRRVGLTTAGLALMWFVAVTFIVMPAINGGALQSEGIYSGVGGSAGGIVDTALSDPGRITARVFSPESGDFTWKLLAPFGLVPLLAPLVLLVGAPQFVLDVMSDVPWTRAITFHYAALPLLAITIAMVEGVAFLSRRGGRFVRVAAPAVVLACSVYGTIAWGPSPVGAEYHEGWWPPAVDTRLATKQAAIDAVPEGASVSASYTLVPHLTHRAEIYSFPNPWRPANWGVPGSTSRSPKGVDWIVIDREILGPEQRLLARILDSGNFKVVLDRDDLIVARRVRG
jgi:uncharacterized membrane protein